jgi:hypothetical protein
MFCLKTEFKTNGSKNASRLKNGLQNGLIMSHGLQMDIPRQVYDLQMPLELAAALDTASASKKCPCAVTDTKSVPHDLQYIPRGCRGTLLSCCDLHEVVGDRRGLEMGPRRLHGLQYWLLKAQLRLNMSYEPLACLYTFFQIEINNNIPLKMPLNIACFIAVCQPSNILLSFYGAAVADRISAVLFPTPSSDRNRISVVDERISNYRYRNRYFLLNHRIVKFPLLQSLLPLFST